MRSPFQWDTSAMRSGRASFPLFDTDRARNNVSRAECMQFTSPGAYIGLAGMRKCACDERGMTIGEP